MLTVNPSHASHLVDRQACLFGPVADEIHACVTDRRVPGLAASLQRVTDCDFIGLSMPGAPGEPLRQHFVHYCGTQGNLKEGMLVPPHGSASGKAFLTGQLVCLDNPTAGQPDPEIYGTTEGREFYRFLLTEGVPSGYFLPLFRSGSVIAVLQLTKYAGKALKPQDAQFLSALAGQLSIAVSNALVHEAVVASSESLVREQVYLREEITRSSMFEEIVGSSKSLRTSRGGDQGPAHPYSPYLYHTPTVQSNIHSALAEPFPVRSQTETLA